jgi:hypothetical protein
MSTAAQHAANIRNAALSTGPRTPEGKAVSSRNAMKFGLTSKQVILPHEDPADFEALESTLIEQLQPADDGERLLLNDIAVARWKIRRIELARTAWLASEMERYRQDHNLAVAYAMLSPEMRRFEKYAAAERRAVENAWRKLRVIQQERRDSEKAAAAARAMADALAARAAALQIEPNPAQPQPVAATIAAPVSSPLRS